VLEDRLPGQDPSSISAATLRGKHGRFSVMPPPVMCAIAAIVVFHHALMTCQ
jgi:hypothetical protein